MPSRSARCLLPPCCCLIGFLFWQWRTRGGWQIDVMKLVPMFGESLLFAAMPFLPFGLVIRALESRRSPRNPLPQGGDPTEYGRLGLLVLYCGAGIYEELLFRAILLGLLNQTLRRALS